MNIKKWCALLTLVGISGLAQAGEVLKAHNDYLQIAAEMGIPALLVFLAIWFIILKSIGRPARALVPESQIPYPASCILYPLILGAGFAFCLSEIFQTPLIALDIPFFSTIIVFAKLIKDKYNVAILSLFLI